MEIPIDSLQPNTLYYFVIENKIIKSCIYTNTVENYQFILGNDDKALSLLYVGKVFTTYTSAKTHLYLNKILDVQEEIERLKITITEYEKSIEYFKQVEKSKQTN
jgi:hypothetical protein